MGASMGGGGGGARRGRRMSRHGTISEINVTPLVDVMLVLLIVFMVAAPLMTVSVPVDLPKTAAKATSSPVEPLFITVQKDKTIYLQETQMKLDELLPKLAAVAKEGKNENLQVRADGQLPYGQFLEVLALLNSAGYTKVSLGSLPLDQPANN